MARLNVFECPGTNVAATVSGQMQYIPPEEIAKGDFCKGLDPSVFNYMFIQGYANQLKPLGPSVAKGVELVTKAINDSTGKFALIGTSQGALIQSQVYKKLKSNEIPRLSDCVGVFLMGNPAREAGKAFPGATSVADGHGIANSSYRLTGTISDNLVWEFARPGDPVCTNGDDLGGQIREFAFNSLLTTFDGTLNSISDVQQVAQDIVGAFSFYTTVGPGMVFFHQGYETWFPNQNDTRNPMRIIIDHLNTIAAPQYRPDGWSTVLTGPSS